MRRKKMWDDMTPQERLHEWELTAIEWEGIIERRKKRQEEEEEKKRDEEKGGTT